MLAKNVKEDYAILRRALAGRVSSLRYFTREFLLIFEEDYITAVREKSTSYVLAYERTHATDFYNKNGTAYCEFLSLFYSYAHGEKV